VVVVGAGTAGIVVATSSGQPAAGQGATGTNGAARVAAKPEPLRLVSVSPASGARDVNGAAGVTVTYNQAPPASVQLPVLSPAIAGSWQRTGDSLVFKPATGWTAGTRVTVTVPATEASTLSSGSGSSNTESSGESVRAGATKAGSSKAGSAKAGSAKAGSSKAGSSGSDAATATVSSFKTGTYSTLRLQEVLAQLGYLPLTWTPAADATAVGDSAGAQLAAAYDPPAGQFGWATGYPSQLHTFWSQGQSNTMDQGAIMGFEADHNLTVDGTASATVWKALLTAVAKDQKNTHGYSYAIASKNSPESLTIWHDGKKVFSSPANTGIAVAPTVDGTFPVYEKLPYQVMSGTNPDGSHYADPVEWVSYFNGGDAVHYFPRGSYGWPQSLGCVELPYTAAKDAYPYLPYGTLVTVA
jgi:lipoprotein-anchoring transpeptidase ErfK/SrfK